MLVELPCGTRVWHIGDPHLGKRFENGVPLHRCGEREARQMRKFKDELATDADVIIMVGDLFDHPQVAMATIIDAVDAIELAAMRRPNVQFFMMAGNHDRSRQLNTAGAWEVFRKIIEGRYRWQGRDHRLRAVAMGQARRRGAHRAFHEKP
jgi:DNA repair exonuclease SbcCD nuclease subunit